jgi:hypothetical protein
MKLYMHRITVHDVVPPSPELVLESDDREQLKRKAESLAREIAPDEDLAWVYEGNDRGYAELRVQDQYRFVVRP